MPPSVLRNAPPRTLPVLVLGVIGAVFLGAAVTRDPSSPFFAGAAVVTAACWLAGGLVSGPLPLGRRDPREPVAVGVVAFGFFAVCALVVRAVPPLDRAVGDVLELADGGRLAVVLGVALLTGLAEEAYFRGAVWRLAPRSPLVRSTAVYVLVTLLATRNPALGLAAVVMGTVFAWQRRRGQGILAPVLTHATWSTLMILLLPR